MVNANIVRELFDYISSSGELVWKKRPVGSFKSQAAAKRWNQRYPGKVAGTVFVTGKAGIPYRYINIGSSKFKAHRLAWAHYYGVMPIGDIDHIDGNGINNRIENLRRVDQGENSRNARLYKRNKSGVCGVYLQARSGCWRASIQKDGYRESLGSHCDFFEAVCARKSAERRLGFSERHGR